MGYYDPYPTHQLEKPLCLVGFMGSEIHMVGYFLSSMTGLPFIELDKWIEHEQKVSEDGTSESKATSPKSKGSEKKPKLKEKELIQFV